MKYLIVSFAIILASCKFNAPRSKAIQVHIDDKRKINQMLIVGIGKAVDYSDISEKMKSDLKDIGGVILYKYTFDRQNRRNIYSEKQTKKLINDIKNNSYIEPFISIDQEGGIVSRLTSSDFFPEDVNLESHEELSKLDKKVVYDKVYKMSKYLKSIGIDINFAPVVDINVNKKNAVISKFKRSFADNADIVSIYAEIYIKATNDAGIISSLKHFPGHGSVSADSHLGFTDVSCTWTENELKPYKYFVKNYHDFSKKNMIMTAHVFNKNLDKKYPATMSYNVNQKILRDQIEFDGILISDDLQMKAISEHFDFEEVVVQAINSGVDMFIVGNNLNIDGKAKDRFVNIVVKNIENGKIDIEKIRNSYNKIIAIKKLYKVL
jgi:beta-N-acetylhexosaminidase